MHTKQLDGLTDEGAGTGYLGEGRLGLQKHALPLSRQTFLPRGPVLPRSPGAPAVPRFLEQEEGRGAVRHPPLQSQRVRIPLPAAPTLPLHGGQNLQLSATSSPGGPRANMHGEGLCQPKI